MAHKPSEYRHIQAWGELMGSMSYYIKSQQEIAAMEDAPVTSVYRAHEGAWRTFEQIEREDTRKAVEDLLR